MFQACSYLLLTAGVAICVGTGSDSARVRSNPQEDLLISLPPPDAVGELRFTRVESVRELSDGRVLVADRFENRVVVLDWGSAEEAIIGRAGPGPGEYRQVGWLYPLSGDSTLLTDSFSGRWYVVDGTTIVRSLSELRPLNRMLGGRLLGADRSGRVVGVRGHRFRSGAPRTLEHADTLVVLLADWASEAVDTVARMKGMGSGGITRLPPSGGRPPTLVGSNPLASRDRALLFPDGWIAVVRADPYRVDWRLPDGRWVQGAPLPTDTIALDNREKCWAMEWFLSRAENPCDPSILPGWPEVLPPFPSVPRGKLPALLATPDGEVVILRTPSTSSPGNRYDVVDRGGRLTGRLALSADKALIGFGEGSVFLLTTDEWDLQRLSRHPWRHTGGGTKERGTWANKDGNRRK